MADGATMLTNAAVGTNWSRNTRALGTFDSPAMALEEGSILADRYEILKLLGQGGMGAVYKARDRELDRLVALKVIRPELAGNASILQRFKQELLLARKITHRNIIRIFDLGVADGMRFITMEFVEGQDLSSLLDERPKYTPEETVNILRQVCAALEAAHAEGVVHRDLKPQNIMIGEGGRVCVMDFGLARSMEATGDDPGWRADGHTRLHVPGASQGHARRRTFGPVLARHHRLLDADRRNSVQGGFRARQHVAAYARASASFHSTGSNHSAGLERHRAEIAGGRSKGSLSERGP